MKKKPVKVRNKHMLAPLRVLAFILVAAACISMFLVNQNGGMEDSSPETVEPVPEPTPRAGDVVEKAADPVDSRLREDKTVYSDPSERDQMVTMYLTVRSGNAEDSTNHTWTEVNTYDTYYYSQNNIERYACEAILQVGDENGPVEGEFGYGETVPNATVCVRGQTSSRNTQKNYKVRIKDGKGTYKDLQTLPLNKMESDYLRFRNKLAFDLMQDIPQMTAIRTQFVHLYVKDETEGGSGQFEDYGLYTRMEQMNKSYLEQHGLDRKGHLYKINNMFEWYDYKPLMNPNLSDDKAMLDFSYYLEPKGEQDSQKLREVLSMVNDYTIYTEEIIDKYFDVENLAYYLAFHLLTGNNDVGARNAYIYSPLNSNRWYILSWDCDRTFELAYNEVYERSDGLSWEQGITKYTNVTLFNRFLTVKKYRQALDDAIQDLRKNYLTADIIRDKVSVYRSIVYPYITTQPDNGHWNFTIEDFDYVTDCLPDEVEANYQCYLESLKKPWPFYVDVPRQIDKGKMHVNWNVSFDPNGESIEYTCILARDPGFTDVIASLDRITVPECVFDVDLAPGQYYIRVQATNESGYTQECFDYFNKDPTLHGKRYGCYAFVREKEGTYVSVEHSE